MDSSSFVDPQFRARATFVLLRTIPLLLAIAIVSQTLQVWLLLFAGVLAAVLLNAPSAWLARRTGFAYPWCFAGVVVGIVAAATGLGALAAPTLSKQIDELLVALPDALGTLRERLDDSTWGQSILERAGDLNAGSLPAPPEIARGVGQAFSAVTGAIAGFVVLLFLGLYGAASPGVYRRGLLSLVGPRHAGHVAGYVDDAAGALRGWLGGTFAAMAVIGVGTWAGPWWLEIPLAPILGVIAAMLTFIPNLGPILAAVPAVLIGLADSPRTALSVAILYVSIQFVESYLITPLIQRRAVQMPPALALGSQLLLGALGGILGLALATPLAAVGIAIVRRRRAQADTLAQQN